MKKSYSQAEKSRHLSEWRASGQTMHSYSVSAGICYQTFYNWAKQPYCEPDAEAAGFAPVSLPMGEPDACPRAELDLGDGLVLRVY